MMVRLAFFLLASTSLAATPEYEAWQAERAKEAARLKSGDKKPD
jgi:hypothetical protein